MNCKINENLGGAQECCGQCDAEQHQAPGSHALEREWRDQERLAIAELVDQAHHLIQEVINAAHGPEVLPTASGLLAQASQLLNWPRPFDPASLGKGGK